jgi:predicted nucleic acid-binding protein
MHIKQQKLCLNAVLRKKLITTWCVITETCYLLQKRVGINAPISLINKIYKGNLTVFDLKPIHCLRIEELMQRYS